MNTASSITIKNDDNKDLLKVEELNLDKIDFTMNKQSTKNSSNLSPILEQLPGMGMTIKHSQSYIATFSKTGNIMKSKGGDLKAILTDKRGKTTEIAKLSKGINLTTLSTLAFQVANIIASQKHLEDISEKLETISKDVKEIKDFLEQERISKIQANLESLQEIKEYLETQENFENNDFYHNQIENIERESKQILNHLSLEFKSLLSEVKNKEKPDEEFLNNQISKYQSKNKLYMVLISQRVISSEIKLIFNPSDELALRRLNNILNEIKITQSKTLEFAEIFKNHNREIEDNKLKDENSSSRKGLLIGATIGLLAGPWGAAAGATIGAGIGSESEEEKQIRIQKINTSSKSYYDNFIYSESSWIGTMKKQINTLKTSKQKDEIKLLITTNKDGNISKSHIIKEKIISNEQ